MPPRHLATLLSGIPNTYVVGGTVRDILTGRSPADIDVATGMPPADAANTLAQRTNGRLVVFSKPNATVYRVVTSSHGLIDVSAFHGHTLEADLSHRDFTLNAMAMDPQTGELTDPLGGAKDLREGRLRQASTTVFVNDPARLLRAFRLCAEFDLRLSPDTESGISKDAARIVGIPGERIRPELLKLLNTPQASRCLGIMVETGLLHHLIPQWHDLRGLPLSRHAPLGADELALGTVAALELEMTSLTPQEIAVPPVTEPFLAGLAKLGTLLADIGRPAARRLLSDERWIDPGAVPLSRAMAARIMHRLRLSRRERFVVDTLIKTVQRPAAIIAAMNTGRLSPLSPTRFFMAAGALAPMVLHVASARYQTLFDCSRPHHPGQIKKGIRTLQTQFRTQYCPRLRQPPLITGKDLMAALNLPPGPRVGQLLAILRCHQLSGTIDTPEAAMAMAARLNAPPAPLRSV